MRTHTALTPIPNDIGFFYSHWKNMSTSHSQKTGCRCDAKTVSNASQPDPPDGLAALSNTGVRTTLSIDISLHL